MLVERRQGQNGTAWFDCHSTRNLLVGRAMKDVTELIAEV